MKKFLGRLILFLSGWQIKNDLDVSKVKSCVLVCAPHTTNWDFILIIGAFWKMNIPMKFFIKDDWTKPWYGYFIKALGGIGVNRDERQNLTDHAASLLQDQSQRLYLVNTPEGTRAYAEHWKRGFYYIAKKGEVPILFAYADYKKKEAGISKMANPKTQTIEEVLDIAQDFYQDISAKYPENFNKNIK